MKEKDLNRVIEECAEVIQAATKILRFGLNGSYPDGRTNIDVLIQECGDVLACIDKLHLPEEKIDEARYAKHRKLRKIEPYECGINSDLTKELHRITNFNNKE